MDKPKSISDEEARAISQHLLDKSGAAYHTDDFDSFAECFIVPGDVHSFGALLLVKDMSDLRTMFDDVRTYFASIQVTALERDCIAAEYSDPDTIKATHMSRMMSGTRLAAQPFPAFSLLRRVDGIWKIASSQYATDDEKLAEALTNSRKTGK